MSVAKAPTNHNTNNFRAIKGLFNQLESYGLNPRDWKIERRSLDISLEKIEMRHRRDQEFRFLGRLDRNNEGCTIIAQMTLISI